mmetsp:Transcript_14354/g.25599  ORF Transcript_14354/g.25599 Transcript_14354/m.25599 type:complete len:574 (-) Transcript_14354:164-1885(-)
MGSKQRTDGKNFWLWGTWGKRVIKIPFLTQKLHGNIRNVIIGASFIIALKEEGKLESWGEDKVGCLGLGTDMVNCADPRAIPLQDHFGKIIDIQYGKHHVLALTNLGKVYAWGENGCGQLGLNDTQTRYEPTFVEGLSLETVTEILAVENMSYALTNHGWVYAWGDNKEGILALEHDNPRVTKPEPMMRMKDTHVKHLEIKEGGGSAGGKSGKTIIAYVELADPIGKGEQIGGFDTDLGEPRADSKDMTQADKFETEIFEGVDLMRRIMDNTLDWWKHMCVVRHGAPYDDNPTQAIKDEVAEQQAQEDNCTALQLDMFVSLDNLEKASNELDQLIETAKAQLQEIRSKRGTKNVKFMLMLFMDDCKLRREKIRRTVAARQLMDKVKAVHQTHVPGASIDEEKYREAVRELKRTMESIRKVAVYDVFTRKLQDTLLQCIECKIQLLETQQELSKFKSGNAGNALKPALGSIKERWGALKRFSIYNLYQDCNLRGQNVTFSSHDEMLAFLVQQSDQKIDQIIQSDRDRLISRDLNIDSLCYELLVENAELRKMCNTYQLKVLLMKEGKTKPGTFN